MNEHLAIRTLERIERYPEEHDQDTWRCGTTACYAGHAVMEDGGIWVGDTDRLYARSDDPADDINVIDGISTVFTSVRARRVLGLTEEQANVLFLTCNTVDDLRIAIKMFLDGCSPDAVLEELDTRQDDDEDYPG